MIAQTRFLSLFASLALLVATSVGCTTLSLNGSGKLDASVAESEIETPQNGPFYLVEVRSLGDSPKVVKYPYRGDETVYNAIENIGGFKRFRRRTTHVIRKNEETGVRLKMEVREDKKGITIDTDYALHPNDRVIVEEDGTTMFHDAIGQVTGPLDRFLGASKSRR
jgi:hypothetical protein